MSTPNAFHLHGGAITVSYFPDGSGPVGPNGRLRLAYQGPEVSHGYDDSEVLVLPADDKDNQLGTIVSVVLVRTVDVGDTTFSLLIPDVELPDGANPSTSISTVGITTVHRSFLAGPGHAQRETYYSHVLHGTAGVAELPQ